MRKSINILKIEFNKEIKNTGNKQNQNDASEK